MKKIYSFLFWLLFSCALIMAILIIRPEWGLMDDTSNLSFVKEFWNSTNKLETYSNFTHSYIGRFRPLYYIWVVSAYSFFYKNPVGFHFFVILLGLLFLPIWGKLIRYSYGKKYGDSLFVIWAYPVSFFLFTPFLNNFMYFSGQEKFIYFFSPLAFIAFLKAYQRQVFVPFIFAAGVAFLCLLSKETGVAVFMTFFIFSFLAAVFCRSSRRISVSVSAVTGVFLIVYYFFIKTIIAGYSAKYEGFSMSVVATRLIHGPAIIKLVFVFALLSAGYFCWRTVKSGSVRELFPALCPFFVITYLVVLSPWGFANYLLAPLGPPVMAMFLPLYLIFWRTAKMKIIKNSIFCLLCIICLFGLIVPRILQLASVKQVVLFLKTADDSKPYLFPAISCETPLRLSELSGKNIKYIEGGTITKRDLSENSAYLIIDAYSAQVHFNDVAAERIMYRNDYWVVVRIMSAIGGKEYYQVNFPETFVQQIVRVLKNR